MLVQITPTIVRFESYVPVNLVSKWESRIELMQTLKKPDTEGLAKAVNITWQEALDNCVAPQYHPRDMMLTVWKQFNMLTRKSRLLDEEGHAIIEHVVLMLSPLSHGHPLMPFPKYEFVAAGSEWADIYKLCPKPTKLTIKIN